MEDGDIEVAARQDVKEAEQTGGDGKCEVVSDVVLERPQSWLDSYVHFVFNYRKWIVFLSWVLVLLGGYIGSQAFFILDNGGFQPRDSDALGVMYRMFATLTYPDYPIILTVEDPTDRLNAFDPEFRDYYLEIQENLVSRSKAYGIIGYYDNSFNVNMISDNEKKVLMYGTISYDAITNDRLEKITSTTPLKVTIGGSVPTGHLFDEYIFSGVEQAEIASIPILFVLLCFSLGGLTAGLLPWYVAIFSILWSLCVLLLIFLGFRISNVATNIVTMFGLGLAIDYTLFVVSRFRTERSAHPNVHVTKIIKRVIMTSGKTVMISCVTVFFALSGGLFFEGYFLSSICLAVMIVAVISGISANFMLLAQLAILDYGIENFFCCCIKTSASDIFNSHLMCENKVAEVGIELSKQTALENNNFAAVEQRDFESHALPENALVAVDEAENLQNDSAPCEPNGNGDKTGGVNNGKTVAFQHADDSLKVGMWHKVGVTVLRWPIVSALCSLAFLLGFSIYFLIEVKYCSFDADYLPSNDDPRVVYDALQTQFFERGETNAFVYIETTPAYPLTSNEFLDSLKDFQDALNMRLGADATNIVSMINIGNLNYTFAQYKDMYANPTSPEYVNITTAIVYPMYLTDLVSATYLEVAIPHYHYSKNAQRVVKTLRDELSSGKYFQGGMLQYGGIGGITALHLDEYDSLQRTLPTWLSIMVVSVYIILMFMTRSLLLPLKAVILSILSLGATFGILFLLFTSEDGSVQSSLDFKPTGYIDGTNIIFIFSVAFGLSVDYEVFLLSRVLEEYTKTKNLEKSILVSMEVTGGIITSAAVMLAVTTFSFIVAKVFFLKVLGVGIALAVVLDATVIRMVLVPASIVLMGDYNMYCPEWLGKIIDAVGIREDENGLEPLE